MNKTDDRYSFDSRIVFIFFIFFNFYFSVIDIRKEALSTCYRKEFAEIDIGLGRH